MYFCHSKITLKRNKLSCNVYGFKHSYNLKFNNKNFYYIKFNNKSFITKNRNEIAKKNFIRDKV